MDECVQETRATFRAMVRDLRTVIEFERLEAGDVEFRKEPVLLSDVARDASAALQLFAADSGKQVVVETTHDSLPVRGDSQYLKEAVVGLASFLLRQPENQKCFIQASAHDGFSRLSVYGNRYVLPIASREHLFDPYPPRAPDKSSRVAQRVGLALANAIVAAQQGTVRIEDSPTASTAFVIELPSMWTAEDSEPTE
jgi:K+-sensing histidine kinase KdpD